MARRGWGGVFVGYMPWKANISHFHGNFKRNGQNRSLFVEEPLHATTEEILDLLPLDKINTLK